MKKLKKNETQYSFIKTILYCLSIAWKSSKFYTICRLLGNIVTPVNVILSSFILKYVIDVLSNNLEIIKAKERITFLLLIILFINTINALSNKVSEYSTRMQNDIIKKSIDLTIMDISTQADLLMFDNADYYDKFAIVQRDSQSVSNILWSTLTLISGIVSMLGTFIILCGTNPYYGILILVTVIPSVIVNRNFTKQVYKLSVSQIKGERKEAYLLYLATQREYSQNIRLFNLGEMLKLRYIKIWNSMFFMRKNLMKKRFLIVGLLQFLPEIAILIININVAFKVIDKMMVIGDFALYNGLITQMWSNIIQTVSSSLDVYDNKMKIDSVESIKHYPKNIINSVKKSINEIDKIEFKNVYFKYPGTDRYILKQLNLSITKNEKIALVGTNGSGKSTLIKLLLRFYDPTKGIILINGIDMKEYDINEMRQCFDTYFQNSLNFGFSIRDNVTMQTSHQINDEEVINAIHKVDGDNILKKSSQGLDTYITRMFDDDGIEISGGEHQKIALARTFFRKNSVVILDEPSSALDPESEKNIFESIEKICENKMVFFTSHRLTNIFLADKILVLEDGAIIENGTKSELLQNKKRFAELYKYQADKFKNE